MECPQLASIIINNTGLTSSHVPLTTPQSYIWLIKAGWSMDICYSIKNGDEALSIDDMGEKIVIVGQQPSEGGAYQRVVMTYADVRELYERMTLRYGVAALALAA